MKNSLLKFYIVAFYLCSTFVMLAEEPGDTDDTGTLESTDTPMPIDDYLWVLMLIGLVYIFIKIRAFQTKKTITN